MRTFLPQGGSIVTIGMKEEKSKSGRRKRQGGLAERKDMRKSRRTKRMQGTPHQYLSAVVTVGLAASPSVKRWLKGRPDAHTVMRRIRKVSEKPCSQCKALSRKQTMKEVSHDMVPKV